MAARLESYVQDRYAQHECPHGKPDRNSSGTAPGKAAFGRSFPSGFRHAKQRSAAAVPTVDRIRLERAMATKVISTLKAHRELAGVAVITADDEVPSLAMSLSARVTIHRDIDMAGQNLRKTVLLQDKRHLAATIEKES
jgi:hypothetical protein